MYNKFKVKLILAYSLFAAACDPYRAFNPDIHPVTTVLQVSPQSDTIKIGDTLWLSCHIPFAYQEGTQRKTLGTDKQVLFSIVHPSWDTLCTSAVTFEGSFKPVLRQGSFQYDGGCAGGFCPMFLAKDDTSYVLKLGLVPKTCGFHTLQLNGLSTDGGKYAFPMIWGVPDQNLYLFPAIAADLGNDSQSTYLIYAQP